MPNTKTTKPRNTRRSLHAGVRVRDLRPTPRTDKLVAEMKGWQQSARAQNLAYLCRKLERELNQIRSAGAQLSNIAFNWAQDKNRPWDDRKMLDECRKLWDTAAHSNGPSSPTGAGEGQQTKGTK